MSDDGRAGYGAAAGAIAVVVFVIGAVVIGERPGMDASGADVATHLAEQRTRIQIGCAINAAVAPLFVWFLATVASLARGGGQGAARAGVVAFGCGVVFVTLFLADVTALAVAALRPANMAAAPELAAALNDFEWLAMGMAAFAAAGVLAALAVLALGHEALWPAWLGRLAALGAAAYALRVGALFTTDGPFAADALLGLYLPVAAFAACTALASITLALRIGR